MIKFSQTIFYVPDVLKTVEFYEVAFGIKSKFVHESNTYAELATEGGTLAFAAEELGETNLPGGYRKNSLNDLPSGCEIVFSTEDPKSLYEQSIKAGAKSLSPPTEKPWGQTVAYVRDPFGILIEIASFMK